jgi:amidase
MQGVALVVVMTAPLSSCTSPFFPKLKGDRAMITYRPPPEGRDYLKLAVKDLIDMKGEVTTAGSRHLAKHGKPAERDAESLVHARRRSDVWFVGRTNLTEFAMGASGLNEYYGTPKNYLGEHRRLMPGGSSSGSAVAVATGKADVAFGTDTAGSVRVPAACCGIYGLKTTFGLVSLKGVHPVSPENLDTVGPMAADVPDLVEGMELLVPGTTAKYEAAAAAHPTGRRLRVARLYVPGTGKAIDEAVDLALKKSGFKVVVLDKAFAEAWKEATKHGNRIAVVEGYESDKEYIDKPGVSGTTRAALLLGGLEHDRKPYLEALEKKKAWERQLAAVLRDVDFIALPTLKRHPLNIPIFGRIALFEALVLEMQNTVAVNYAGNPAIAIPVPVEDKRVPLTSLQLIGPKNSEAKLLNAARIVASKNR